MLRDNPGALDRIEEDQSWPPNIHLPLATFPHTIVIASTGYIVRCPQFEPRCRLGQPRKSSLGEDGALVEADRVHTPRERARLQLDKRAMDIAKALR